MVIFHSYVSLLEGNYYQLYWQKTVVEIGDPLPRLDQGNIPIFGAEVIVLCANGSYYKAWRIPGWAISVKNPISAWWLRDLWLELWDKRYWHIYEIHIFRFIDNSLWDKSTIWMIGTSSFILSSIPCETVTFVGLPWTPLTGPKATCQGIMLADPWFTISTLMDI